MTPLILVGAGGHARVVLELVRALGTHTVIGFIDPQPAAPTLLGVRVLGGDEMLPALRAQGVAEAFVAIGNNHLRHRVSQRLHELGFTQPALAHPSAFLSASARREAGSLVMAHAVLGTEARLLAYAILNSGAVADHDTLLEEACHIAPGCAVAGQVRVGPFALVGVGSAVRPGITIGAGAVIGAGSAVVADVPERARVGGTPARPLRTGVVR